MYEDGVAWFDRKISRCQPNHTGARVPTNENDTRLSARSKNETSTRDAFPDPPVAFRTTLPRLEEVELAITLPPATLPPA